MFGRLLLTLLEVAAFLLIVLFALGKWLGYSGLGLKPAFFWVKERVVYGLTQLTEETTRSWQKMNADSDVGLANLAAALIIAGLIILFFIRRAENRKLVHRLRQIRNLAALAPRAHILKNPPENVGHETAPFYEGAELRLEIK